MFKISQLNNLCWGKVVINESLSNQHRKELGWKLGIATGYSWSVPTAKHKNDGFLLIERRQTANAAVYF